MVAALTMDRRSPPRPALLFGPGEAAGGEQTVGFRNVLLGLGALVASVPASAQQALPLPAGPEVAVAVLDHGVRKFFRDAPPPGIIYASEEERGTVDVQFVYRLPPMARVLDARPNARLQINTGGRTSFAAIGAEWRQHVLGNRVYGQIGIGLAVHDGYRVTPDPFVPGLSPAERRRRIDLFERRTSFGSRVLFNPNVSVGFRLTDRWAAELAWEHFSHKKLFSNINPGIDNVGIRLVRMLGPR